MIWINCSLFGRMSDFASRILEEDSATSEIPRIRAGGM